jgi:hypothetical protein
MYSQNTNFVDLSSFSIGVPVKPIKEAFGRASLRYFAFQYFISEFQLSFSTIFQVNQY